jgi:hypothetical protein
VVTFIMRTELIYGKGNVHYVKVENLKEKTCFLKKLNAKFFLEHVRCADWTNPHAGNLEPSVLRLRILQPYVPLRATISESVPAWDFVQFAQNKYLKSVFCN